MRKVTTFREFKDYVSGKGKSTSSIETRDNECDISSVEIEDSLSLKSQKWAKGSRTSVRKVSLKSTRCGIFSSIRRKVLRSDAISSSETEDCYNLVPSTQARADSDPNASMCTSPSAVVQPRYCSRTSGTDVNPTTFIHDYQEPDAVDDPDDSWHSGSSCSHVPEIPVRPAQTLQFVANGSTRENSMYATVKLSADNSPCRSVHSLTDELLLLSKHGWYWGPITRSEAEEKLIDQSDGAFLVRDSSDDRYLLSLSFRSYGKTLHTRIERCNGLFSFYLQPEHEGHESIVELIQNSMACSQTAVFCYSRARVPGAPSFPVRLMKPVSRFTQVRSLQYLCRFVIRQTTRLDHIQKLPLPNRIKGYIEEGHY